MTKPVAVARVHRQICASSKCEYLDKIDYIDPCGFCPNRHFGRYQAIGCTDFGDKVAAIAKPIARGIDAVLGTHISNCGGCHQMQRDLNAGVGIIAATAKRLHPKK